VPLDCAAIEVLELRAIIHVGLYSKPRKESYGNIDAAGRAFWPSFGNEDYIAQHVGAITINVTVRFVRTSIDAVWRCPLLGMFDRGQALLSIVLQLSSRYREVTVGGRVLSKEHLMNKHPIFLFLSIPLSLIFVAAAALVILPSLRAQTQAPVFAVGTDAYVQNSAYIQDAPADPSASGLAIVAAVAATELPQPIISLPGADVLAVLNKARILSGAGPVFRLDTDDDRSTPDPARSVRTLIFLIPGTPPQTMGVVYVVDGPHHLCTIKTGL
jgi:hypothetical protein